MPRKILMGLLLLKAACCAQQKDPEPNKKNFVYNQYKYDTKITVSVNNDTEQILDFVEDSELSQLFPTRVHVSTNGSVPGDYPVFITAQQQKGISSWELPLVINSQDNAAFFNEMARTLCPHDAGPDIKTESSPTIHVTTRNPANTTVDIKLRRVTDFYVEVNKEISLNVTPSTPKYYYFSFNQNPWNVTKPARRLQGLPIFNYTIPKSVILIIDSDDDVCAEVSIQNNSCPVFDNEKEIMYQGYHLTMDGKGGITLTQTMFPLGFYVVFVAKESDAECTGASETEYFKKQAWRRKSFRFTVIATVSYKEYMVGAVIVFVLAALVAAFVALVAIPFRRLRLEEQELQVDEPMPSTSGSVQDEPSAGETCAIVANEVVDSAEEQLIPEKPVPGSGRAEDDAPASATAVTRSPGLALTVGRLSRAPPDTLARRSERYFWGALTVAVVYSLPVVQLLFTYQQMVLQTGNQDLCYYNFLCAHPLGALSDFNHVYSNVAYVMFGLAFMLQVRTRQRNIEGKSQEFGIPQHHGLLYSMGLALCMEGFLSACYHLCPNKMNFQFDSSFMYVIAVLVMLKLYQNRHSDIIPSAHSTFMVIAVIMAIGLCGILFPSAAFSALFTVAYLLTCFVLTLKIYYAGEFQMKWGVVRRAWAGARAAGRGALVPAHTARAVLLALANLANWTYAIYTAYERREDFARQLLAVLMGNAILYTLFYIAMKLIHREKILPHTWFYCVCAHLMWFAALERFLHGNTKWSETPAASRRHNAVCSSLQLFDAHDVWHVESAVAMFLSFNMLLTIDDALALKRNKDIATF